MMVRLDRILGLLGEDEGIAESRKVDAENAENAVIPLPDRVTAFRSFTASTRAFAHAEHGPAPLVCFSCSGSDFWEGTGTVTCRRCHPPAPGAEVPSPDSSSSPARSVPDTPSPARASGPDRRGVSGGGVA